MLIMHSTSSNSSQIFPHPTHSIPCPEFLFLKKTNKNKTKPKRPTEHTHNTHT